NGSEVDTIGATCATGFCQSSTRDNNVSVNRSRSSAVTTPSRCWPASTTTTQALFRAVQCLTSSRSEAVSRNGCAGSITSLALGTDWLSCSYPSVTAKSALGRITPKGRSSSSTTTATVAVDRANIGGSTLMGSLAAMRRGS